MTSRSHDPKGFTIWEFLIVLVVIVILAAIALPAYQDYTTESRTETGSVPDKVGEALKAMTWGQIAFNNPEVLAYGESAIVELLLSENKTEDQLLSIIRESGKKESYQVRLSTDMEARLTGRAFEITPITPEHQAVSPTDVTKWKWEIRAKEFGAQKLFLTLNANLVIDGREKQHTVQSFSRTLNVRVVWPQSAMYFFSSYWQWIFTAIALPFIGWFASRTFGKKAKNVS